MSSKIATVIDGGLSGYDRLIQQAWPNTKVLFLSAYRDPGPDQEEIIAASDIVIFGGGADVDPAYYGHTRHRVTYISPQRDPVEKLYYDLAMKYGRPMTGICRGAQFLWAMSGGKLYQDVDHDSFHLVTTPDGREVMVNSVHHQLCADREIPVGMVIEAFANQTTSQLYDTEWLTRVRGWNEIEAWGSSAHKVFGVQYHPEGFNCPRPGIDLYFELFTKYIGE